MSNIWEKITLLTKPEQSGKTFIMLQKIVSEFSEEPRPDKKKILILLSVITIFFLFYKHQIVFIMMMNYNNLKI